MIKNGIEFIKNGIWQKKDYEYKTKKARWAVRQFKVFIFTAKGFGEHSLIVRSAALTFYTLMAIVPIAALIFGIVKGFGMETRFNEYLYMAFPQYSVLIDQIINFANNMLLRTKGGIIASVGFVLLIWSVMKVFGNIESAFNHIWEVRRARSVARKFSDYITIVFIAPILWIISNSLTIYVKTQLSSFTTSVALEILYAFASMASLWLMFAFVYHVMPNTKVKIRSALMAGIVAGTIFQIFQVGYIYIQTQVTSYNAIYGSFAALPLFLIWLQISWQILLFGAELSFAYQNVSKYEQEREALNMSYDSRRKVMLASMLIIVRHFINNKGAATSETVASELNLPVRIVRDVIFDLEGASLILAVKSDHNEKESMYVPAKDVHKISVCNVINAVEMSGANTISIDESLELHSVSGILDAMRSDTDQSGENIMIMDII